RLVSSDHRSKEIRPALFAFARGLMSLGYAAFLLLFRIRDFLLGRDQGRFRRCCSMGRRSIAVSAAWASRAPTPGGPMSVDNVNHASQPSVASGLPRSGSDSQRVH